MSVATSLIRSKQIPASLDVAPPLKMKKYDWVKLKLLKDQRGFSNIAVYANSFVYTLAHLWKNPITPRGSKSKKKEVPCIYYSESTRTRDDPTAHGYDHCNYIPREDLLLEEVFSATKDHFSSIISSYAKTLELQKKIQTKKLEGKILGSNPRHFRRVFLEKVFLVPDLSWDLNKSVRTNFRGEMLVIELNSKFSYPVKFDTLVDLDLNSINQISLEDLLTCENEFLRKRYADEKVKKTQDSLMKMESGVQEIISEYSIKLHELRNERAKVIGKIEELAGSVLDPSSPEKPWRSKSPAVKKKVEKLLKRISDSCPNAKTFFTLHNEELSRQLLVVRSMKAEIPEAILNDEWLKDIPPE